MAKVISSGTIPILRNLEMRREVPEPLAAASSLVDRKKISRMVAAKLSIAVSPIVAMAVNVVTVVVDTVVIILFSCKLIRMLAYKSTFVKT